jgi:hypothetical protein
MSVMTIIVVVWVFIAVGMMVWIYHASSRRP